MPKKKRSVHFGKASSGKTYILTPGQRLGRGPVRRVKKGKS